MSVHVRNGSLPFPSCHAYSLRKISTSSFPSTRWCRSRKEEKETGRVGGPIQTGHLARVNAGRFNSYTTFTFIGSRQFKSQRNTTFTFFSVSLIPPQRDTLHHHYHHHTHTHTHTHTHAHMQSQQSIQNLRSISCSRINAGSCSA